APPEGLREGGRRARLLPRRPRPLRQRFQVGAETVKAATVTAAGSVVGGFLASVCCIVPLAFAALGISGAGFALRFEPLRPYLLVLTYALLGGAFCATYRSPPEACSPGASCES